VSLEQTDCERAHVANEAHLQRNKQRHEFLVKHPGEDPAKKKRSVPHDKEKWQQQMEADQLLESLKRYGNESIAALPESFREQITIRKIKQAGMLAKDRAVEKHRNALEDEKDARHKKKMPSDEHWEKQVADAKIEADETWLDQDTLQRRSNIERLSSKGYWERLCVKDGFHNELKLVLPNCWNDGMKVQSKRSILPKVRQHLDLVHSIAKKKSDNTVSNVDVSHLDFHNTLELFVRVDSSPMLKLKQENERKRVVATDALMKLGGTDIAQKYKDMGPK